MFDLIAHLNEEPPAYRILAAVHLDPDRRRTTPSSSPRAREDISDSAASEIMGALGSAPQAMPTAVRERALWAQREIARLTAERTKR